MILSGKDLSAKIKDELKGKIDSYLKKPLLAVISIGNDEASKIYVENKRKACHYISMSFMLFTYNENDKEEKIIKKIKELNKDDSVNGIIVQLPIPDNFSSKKIINAISPEKDVDGLTEASLGKILSMSDGYIPCTPKGIMKLFEHYKIDLAKKHVTVIGRSTLVGKPIVLECLKRDATVTICHSKTRNLKKHCLEADILICAVGKKYLIKEDMVKKGATVIDVGISRVGGKIYGDVDPKAHKLCKNYSTVPGGVGPMTVIMLLENTFEAYKKQNGVEDETTWRN